MTKYLDNIGLAALWQKIKQSTSEVIICQSGEYDAITLMPTIEGTENNIYLVPYSTGSNVAIVGTAVVGQSMVEDLGQQNNIDTNNQYQEWIFKNSRFERVGERISDDKDITDMLEELGFIETVALIDSAIIDEAVVG